MKVLKTSLIGVLFCVCYSGAFAQDKLPLNEPDYNKPHLFSDLPKKMKLRISDMEGLLDLPVGASVKTFLSDHFNFHGTVVSKSDAGSTTVKSVVIKSTNRKGATLSFTRVTNPDGTIKYLGRVMSFKNGDAYEIVQEGDEYIFQKKNLYDIINE